MPIEIEKLLHRVILTYPLYGILSHMMLLQETVIFREVTLKVELHADLRYRLCYGDLVEYENSRKRMGGGRWSPYVFKSVEQCRCAVARAVRAAGGRLDEAG